MFNVRVIEIKNNAFFDWTKRILLLIRYIDVIYDINFFANVKQVETRKPQFPVKIS